MMAGDAIRAIEAFRVDCDDSYSRVKTRRLDAAGADQALPGGKSGPGSFATAYRDCFSEDLVRDLQHLIRI